MPTREKRARALGVALDELPADTRGRHGNHARGRDAHRWNDERILSSHGYVKLRVGIEHPLADPNGYAYEHLIVWVSAGNPRPAAGMMLHHMNETKTDNRLSNIELISRSLHTSRHIASRPRDERGRLLPNPGRKE